MKAKLHKCFCINCAQQIPNNKLACIAHWKRVPKWLQGQVVEHWKFGLQRKMHPTADYTRCVGEAAQLINEQDLAKIAKADALNYTLGSGGMMRGAM